MRKLVYRGPEQILRCVVTSKTVYCFEARNKFTVQALTWADYYDLISFDSTHKLIVDAQDELARTDLKRRTQFEYEVPAEIYIAQEERNKKSAEEKLYKSCVEKYKNGIIDKIASGILEAFPDDYEEAAIAFADKMTKPVKEVVETPVKPTEPTEELPVEPVDETPEEAIPEVPVEEVLEETPVVVPVKKGKK